ncbi:MAG: glucohydrolase [Anaerolineae bacterium CG_4_9_14_3_um_filter_57_17]|nr:MAG: glucohydrolase [Anaerolineae bacterium CG_4_9_14_3_um_filter_57_17]
MSLKWWQSAVFYQIYPRSFADGNGDGIGDFAGMTEKLDYLKALGVDALWLSPHFPSPNWDCGYDISDYCGVAPEYGDLSACKRFLREAHARSLRVILDLVLNHTSDEHPWFLESKSSRDNPKADWYVWADTPPNNWQSCFDGEAWTYAPERSQYYYHYFMKQQPDLNWRNPAVEQAMWDAARFWLDLGVDGFRLDAIGTIYEDPALTPHSVPLNLAQLRRASELAQTPAQKRKIQKYWFEMFKNQWGGPGLHDLMQELRAILDEYPGDRMLVGEDDNIDYMGDGDNELHLVFNFPLMRGEGPLTPAHIRKNQRERLARLAQLPAGGWPCNALGNHDSLRMYTRFSDGLHSAELARVNLALLLTLRGTPFLYNGEEIGMTDYTITDPALLRDTMAVWYYDSLVNELHIPADEAARRAGEMSRDKNRTPLQWSAAPNGGFCPAGVTPWLPVNPNYEQGVNVRDQQDDPTSMLNYYRHLLRLRKALPALVDGDYTELLPRDKDVLAFVRANAAQRVLVILNYSEERLTLNLSRALGVTRLRTLFSSSGRNRAEESARQLHLGAFEVYLAYT